VGRILSVIGRPESSTPLLSVAITSYDPATGTLAVSPQAVVWRPARGQGPPASDLRQLNVRTLNVLDESKLLRGRPDSVYRRVANDWLFPLYPLDLGETKIDPEELREVQRNWSPDED
jgi:hypothetical protein